MPRLINANATRARTPRRGENTEEGGEGRSTTEPVQIRYNQPVKKYFSVAVHKTLQYFQYPFLYPSRDTPLELG